MRNTAWIGVALIVALIVLGGIVRITGSGMGCGDHWPRCNGEWFPPLDLPTFIEILHRWVAALVSVVVVLITVIAWLRHRGRSDLLIPATAGTVLLVVQVLLGAVTVKLELPAWVVILHLVNAMLLLAVIVVTALRSAGPPAVLGQPHGRHWLTVTSAILGLVAISLGASVANLEAAYVCLGFPLCDGGLLPPASTLGTVHWTHRVVAYVLAGLVGLLAWDAARLRAPVYLRYRRAVWSVVGLVVAQIGVGAAMVLLFLPGWARATHVLGGTLMWLSLVVLVHVSRRSPALEDTLVASAQGTRDEPARPPAAPEPPGLLRDLISLTKPRVVSLLLLTAIAAMFVTKEGPPPASLVLWVALGGFLMAGGANAINMWFDQDIDHKMGRTKARPVPSGRVSPGLALVFGLSLGLVAFALLWLLVNPLAALLALAGLVFYVVVYTIGLKRSTPQNIVIGGAAGAFPPLVGYAAVAGTLDLAAAYLFLIIFFWTPPHFWALALVKRADYARAGVPMLPVVVGDRYTKIQILLYTLLLFPLTITPALFGAFGLLYTIAAALLGGRFLWYCAKLLKTDSTIPLARRMYRYSLIYLALLFIAMGVDRAWPIAIISQPQVVTLIPPVDSTEAAHHPAP